MLSRIPANSVHIKNFSPSVDPNKVKQYHFQAGFPQKKLP
jgi:hypothetical protein